MAGRRGRALLTALAGTLAVLAAGAGDAGGAAPTSAAAPRAAASGPAALATPLRVLDWNVQGGQGTDGVIDFDRIIEVIQAEDPDVVTLQELHDNTDVGGENQWQLLLDALPGWDAHFACSDRNAYGGVAGNLILSRFPIEERLTHPLPPYDAASPADRDCPLDTAASPVRRSMGGARIDVGGTDVRVYTTHLSPGLSEPSVDRRQEQARNALDKLPASLLTTPMLLTGDFNLRPDDEIRFWTAGEGWYDAWTEVAPNIGEDAITYPGDTEDARIDYVYATSGFDVTAAHTVRTGASDHLPVVVDLAIPDATPVETGSVLAGAEGLAGWAHLSAFDDGGATLRVCDNKPDGWGVRAYLRDGAGGDLAVTGADPAYADQCGTFTVPAGTLSQPPSVRVCLYAGGEEKDCRQRDW
ncbi:endonuclease/exonuclease/phosphatase family protein [Streptomyces sp. B6B3]|uniref:endonuclease/exonuclease/phosphatase family protein n=1 Tax=Streptomyces sp. B6B3 TaxID=3153570 RepID=UPI00325C4397